MKEQFSYKLALNGANKARLHTINNILEDYASQGYVLTLRQLYYQLVSKDIIANNLKEYAKLSTLLTKGRMAGVVDWASIEDRGRIMKLPYCVGGVKETLNNIYHAHRLDRMKGQNTYIEICIEKDALSNIFERVTNEFHIRLTANKGYSSSSAIYAIYERIVLAYEKGAQKAIIIYFGDHDPSGRDMIRDVESRVSEMLENGNNQDLMKSRIFGIVPVALNMTQIRQYNPPENPAKISDQRAKDYIAEFGNKSWELDALPPNVLVELTRDTILNYIDLDKYNSMIRLERKQKKDIWNFKESYNDSSEESQDEDESDEEE